MQEQTQNTQASLEIHPTNRRTKNQNARDKNMIPNLIKAIKPLFHSIIGEIPNQQGDPSIVSLLRRLFITRVFKRQDIPRVYNLLMSVIQKKISPQQKKAQGERIKFHEKNIDTLNKVVELTTRILECVSVDEQFISQIVTFAFSQTEEDTGKKGREVIQQNKIRNGINKIKNDIFQQEAVPIRETSAQGQAINTLDENESFINPPLLENVLLAHQGFDLQQNDYNIRFMADSIQIMSLQEMLSARQRFDTTPILIFELDESYEITFGVQCTAEGIFQ